MPDDPRARTDRPDLAAERAGPMTPPPFPANHGVGRMIHAVRTRLQHRLLLAFLMVAACGWTFAQLADETGEGDTQRFDENVLLALRDPADRTDPLGPPWIEEFGRDVTALGSLGVLLAITVAAAGYLWLLGKRRTMLLVLIAVLGGQAASTLFKIGFDRPRPDLVPHGAVTYTSSFPSGHAMMAAVTYLTLAALLARVQPRRRLKGYLIGLAALVTLAVGISRVYLGVHWPTDVLGGWTAGAAWALACLAVAGWLQGRGVIAPEGAERASTPPAPRAHRRPRTRKNRR